MDFEREHPVDMGAGDLASMPADLSILVHDTIDVIEARWHALETRATNSLHHTVEWCRDWIAAYKRPYVIVEGRQGDETAFILPLEIVKGRLFTKAQFIGSDHANLNTGIYSERFMREATPEMMAAIVADIRGKIHGADCIVLANMPAVWRDEKLPFGMLPGVENQNHAFALTIKDTFVATLAQLNAKRRRKKYSVSHRRLEAFGSYEHRVATTAEEKQRILDHFYAQKGARLAEFGLPNTFACPKTRKFFHSIAQEPQGEDHFSLRLHYIQMTSGEFEGEIPAVAGLSRKGDHIIVQFCSIGDGPMLHASPGELLFHLMIERYNEENVALFDFGIGDMGFKRAWCNVETIQNNVTIPLTSLGHLAALKEEASTRLKATIKQNPAVYAFLQRIRARNLAQAQTDGEGDND